jgi:cytochrome c-type biogenesis protein CcmF
VFFGVVVATGIGLLAWRGDLLRSPGSIESPVSREGAFLANNLLFAAFTFIVLLGTVFPLIAQALRNQQITVGSPYFDTMTMPIVVCLLFLMAVAPILPWRRTTTGLVRTRLFWPAAVGVATIVACVIGGIRGFNPLLAFGLGAFAGTSALRQLFIEVRRRGVRGFTGSTGGGMIVHLGVVLIAVGFAASHSFAHQSQLTLAPGQTAEFDGHSFTYLGTKNIFASTHTALAAEVRVDGRQVFGPAISDYPFATEGIGTPSVDSGLSEDIYLTLAQTPTKPGGAVGIGVIIEPLVTWIWIGGAVMLVGAVLAALPGNRKYRPDAAEVEVATGVPASGEPAAAAEVVPA